MVKKMIEQQEK